MDSRVDKHKLDLQNILSLGNKVLEACSLIEDSKLDLLILTETWLKGIDEFIDLQFTITNSISRILNISRTRHTSFTSLTEEFARHLDSLAETQSNLTGDLNTWVEILDNTQSVSSEIVRYQQF